jgi:hypothetical protein
MRETDQETDDDEEFSSLIEETPSLEIELSSFSFSPGRDVDGGSDRNRQQRIVGSGPGAKESRRRLLLHHSLKRKCFILLATISLFAGLIAIHVIQTKENGDLMKESSKYHINNLHENVTISCPLEIDKSANDKDAMLSEFYDDFNKKTISKTVDLKKLKNSSYDGWGKNYNQFKTDIYQWKCQHFSTLKSGETIFESGCGSGLNLLMTVETLKECANIDHLQVYGIEYVKSSVEEANLVLDQLLPQVGNATLGSQICQGDASDLFFIPSNSFDLSYTGELILTNIHNIGCVFHSELSDKIYSFNYCSWQMIIKGTSTQYKIHSIFILN